MLRKVRIVIKFIKKLFSVNKVASEQNKIYNWLASSSSLEEIERRQRMLSRGEAPWQIAANRSLKDWV